MKVQRGYVTKKSGAWLGHYSKWVADPSTGIKRRKQFAEKLGPTSMTLTKAREALNKLLVREMGMTGDSRMTVSGFIEQRWKPLHEGDWRESTKATNEELFKIITDRFGNDAIEDIDSVALTTWLNSIAKTRSGSAVRHCRIFLRSIFSEAVEQGYISKSPARLLKVPNNLRAVQRQYLFLPEIKALLKAATWFPRELALLRFILVTALRPSELLALRWKNLDLEGRTLTITETVYRGVLRPYTKTTDAGEVQQLVIPELAVQPMTDWRAESKYSGEEDFIFPNASGGFWLKENYQRRVLTPLVKRAALAYMQEQEKAEQPARLWPHVNFQVLRRTVSTHAQSLGSPKDIATLMRHRDTETAQRHYIQAFEETVKSTTEKLAEKMYQQ